MGDGIYFPTQSSSSSFVPSLNISISGDPEEPTVIMNNGRYQIHNGQLYSLSVDPLAAGNLDARNVWWGSTDIAAINEGIFDFFDDSYRGIVFTDPIAIEFSGPFSADYNGDGTVDAADYTVWRDGDSPDSATAGYALWVANFGQSTASGSGADHVPEPTTLLLALLALATVPLRVRHG